VSVAEVDTIELPEKFRQSARHGPVPGSARLPAMIARDPLARYRRDLQGQRKAEQP
jgi:hypothetical protein